MNDPILTIRDLKIAFGTQADPIEALRGVNLSVRRGECLGLVGESGSGKSLTALAAMRLLPPAASITHGSVLFEGKDMTVMARPGLEQVRGNDISMIFQEPMTALNPVMRVGEQIAAPLRKHKGLSAKAARARAIEQMDSVGIPDPHRRIDNFPHELSGGMRQRVMIAMALLCQPKILIADEPTTALDVTVQAQMLDLFKSLTDDFGTSLVLITHDLGVVAGVADRMMVMYGGRAVEKGRVDDLFYDPRHPYTLGLLHSTPHIARRAERLDPIQGLPPSLERLPQGCSFHPRCAFCFARCIEERPLLLPAGEGREKACFYEGPLQSEKVA